MTDQHPQKGTSFALTALLVCVAALVPWPGRWKLLQQIVPLLLIATFYWSGKRLPRTVLGPPPGGCVRCLLLALGLGLPLYFLKRIVFGRLAGAFFPSGKDLSLFSSLEGDLPQLLIFLAFMWVLAAFGEELIWRGFLLRELANRSHLLVGLGVSSVLFGLAHAYQGGYGVIEKTLGALTFGVIYAAGGRSNLWLVVFIHGLQNTISFVAIYFGVYEMLDPFG